VTSRFREVWGAMRKSRDDAQRVRRPLAHRILAYASGWCADTLGAHVDARRAGSLTCFNRHGGQTRAVATLCSLDSAGLARASKGPARQAGPTWPQDRAFTGMARSLPVRLHDDEVPVCGGSLAVCGGILTNSATRGRRPEGRAPHQPRCARTRGIRRKDSPPAAGLTERHGGRSLQLRVRTRRFAHSDVTDFTYTILMYMLSQ